MIRKEVGDSYKGKSIKEYIYIEHPEREIRLKNSWTDRYL